MFDAAGIYIIKVHRNSGQEVVYSIETGEIAPDNSTYNYGSQTNWFNSYYEGIHRVYDISTHAKWLESKEAYLEMISGGDSGVSEEEAVSKAREAENDEKYSAELNMYREELQLSQSGLVQDGTKIVAVYSPFGGAIGTKEVPNYVPYNS